MMSHSLHQAVLAPMVSEPFHRSLKPHHRSSYFRKIRSIISRNICNRGLEAIIVGSKKNMPKIGGFQSFNTARKTIKGFEAMLWLRKGFGFSDDWNVLKESKLIGLCFGLQNLSKACNEPDLTINGIYTMLCDRP